MKKILLVDDSRALRTLVGRHLRERGCEILEANDGQEGVLLALQHRPDLVLLDVSMPYLDGPSALARIRTKESIRNTPVIMMTASSDRDTVLKLARLGVQDYIIKPFTLDLLLEKVERVLDKAAAERLAAEESGTSANSTVDTGPGSNGSVPLNAASSTSLVDVGSQAPGRLLPDWPSAGPQDPAALQDNPELPNLLLVGVPPRTSAQLRAVLSSRFDFFLAADADQAIQLASTYTPHAVIFALHSSTMEPVESYKRLKYLPALLHTPFIAIRHDGDSDVTERIERMGFLHFLLEPIDPEALTRLFEALEKERQAGHYGANYMQVVHGVPVLKWPVLLRLERLKQTTWELEDNLERGAKQGQRLVAVQIGAMRAFHDGHLLLMLAVQKKAQSLGIEIFYVTQNPLAVQFFRQYEDTRELTFYPSVEEGCQALSSRTSPGG